MKAKNLILPFAMLFVALFFGCAKDDYVEVAGTCPAVLSTSPLDDAVSVSLDKTITATFNEEMDPATINEGSFLLSGGILKASEASVTGAVTYTGTTASFTPSSPLALNTTYTGTIKASIKNLTGNALQADYIWSFSTGSEMAPTITATTPLNLATNVPLNQAVNFNFSEAMNASTITNGTTFTLTQGGTSTDGTVLYSGTMATFTPGSNLLENTLYTATISTDAKSLAGTAIGSDYIWTFTTGTIIAPMVTATNPLNLATNVSPSQIINFNFSEAMDASTITNGTTFTLTQGGTSTDGTILYSGTMATFTPSSNLLPNTLYMATISTDAKNLAGTAIMSDYVWSFTTLDGALAGPGIVDLGTSGNFAILTKSGISTTGNTLVTGDIGVSPIDQTAISGFSETMDISGEFSTSIYVVGKIYAADYMDPTPAYVSTAISDQETAFTTANGLTTNVTVDLGAGDISGMTLAPGLYKWGTGLLITNAGVTLSGGPDDTWVFQIADDFTINNDAIITLSGGAQAKNIFWVTAAQALIGSNVEFNGNILAQTLISLNTGSTVTGRLLSQSAVTLQASTVNTP